MLKVSSAASNTNQKKIPECPLLSPLLTKMSCAWRCIKERFVNLFLKKSPRVAKHFYER